MKKTVLLVYELISYSSSIDLWAWRNAQSSKVNWQSMRVSFVERTIDWSSSRNLWQSPYLDRHERTSVFYGLHNTLLDQRTSNREQHHWCLAVATTGVTKLPRWRLSAVHDPIMTTLVQAPFRWYRQLCFSPVSQGICNGRRIGWRARHSLPPSQLLMINDLMLKPSWHIEASYLILTQIRRMSFSYCRRLTCYCKIDKATLQLK